MLTKVGPVSLDASDADVPRSPGPRPLQVGLEKLLTTEESVSKMQEELIALQPQLVQSGIETEEAMVVIARETVEADEVKAVVAKEEAAASEEAAGVKAIKVRRGCWPNIHCKSAVCVHPAFCSSHLMRCPLARHTSTRLQRRCITLSLCSIRMLSPPAGRVRGRPGRGDAHA